MKKEHIWYYIVTLFIVFLGITLAFLTSYNPMLQKETFFLTAFLYVVWGSFHHFIEHDLTLGIVVEYILMAALGLVIVSFFVSL